MLRQKKTKLEFVDREKERGCVGFLPGPTEVLKGSAVFDQFK